MTATRSPLAKWTLALALCAGGLGCLEERSDADPGQAVDAAAVDVGGGDVSATADGSGAPDDAGAVDVPPPLLALGKACVASSECGSGRCAMPCEGYGVCAPAKCEADSDCAVAGSKVTHCCIGGTCSAIPGGACGDRKGQQGTKCGVGGQSDCAEGLACLSPCVSTAYCAAPCTDGASCAAKGKDLACFKTPAAGKRCVGDPNKAISCDLDTQCQAGVCSPYPSFSGTKVIKVCKKPAGPGVAGSKCAAGKDCAAGFCLKGYCTKACTEDAHCKCDDAACELNQICVDVTFSLSKEISAATELCYPATRCDAQPDCPPSKTCVLWPGSGGWEHLCVKGSSLAKVPGYACETHADCKNGACYDKECREPCTKDEHCAKGTCKEVVLDGAVPAGSKTSLCL